MIARLNRWYEELQQKAGLSAALWAWTGLAFAAVILLTHGQALPYFYIQDDSQAVVYSEHWWTFYGAIASDLQYRPNAYLITWIVDHIFPHKAWPLRLYGLFAIWTIGMAQIALVRRLTNGNLLLALASALLLVSAPGFYSYATIYLTASMTGLGVLLLMLILYQAHRHAQNSTPRGTVILCGLFVLGLTSYEITIIALPLAMLTHFLWRPWNGFWRQTIEAIKDYAPFILIALIYLVLRWTGIHAEGHDPRLAKLYEFGFGGTLTANIKFQLANGLGIAQLRQYVDPWGITLALYAAILFLSWRLAARNNLRRVYAVCCAWLVLGLAPFVIAAGNGQAFHYVTFILPPVTLLAAMAAVEIASWCGRFTSCALIALLCLAIGANGVVIWQNYARDVFTNQAIATRQLDREFKALSQDVLAHKTMVMLNIGEISVWRMHWGYALNMSFRQHPYDFWFPQAASAWQTKKLATLSDKDPAWIYADQYEGDHRIFYKTQLVDVTPWVNRNGPWTKTDRTQTLKTKDAVQIIWSPAPGMHGPLTVRFDAHMPEEAWPKVTATLTGENGKKLTCELVGTNGSFADLRLTDYSMTFPPRRWRAGESVTLEIPGRDFMVRGVYTRPDVWLPEADQLQFCSDSLFSAARP